MHEHLEKRSAGFRLLYTSHLSSLQSFLLFTSRGGSPERAEGGVGSTWRVRVQGSGDCKHHIYHLSIQFHNLHQKVVPLVGLMQALQVIVHITFFILKFVFRIYIKKWCLWES